MARFGQLGARIRRTRSGSYKVDIAAEERELIDHLVPQLRGALMGGAGTAADVDPMLRRLFPSAYPDDEHRDTEFRELMHDDLLRSQLGNLDVLEESVRATELDEEQMHAWIGAVNSLRLVLGTRLDVSEEDEPTDLDPDDPETAPMAIYHYLGHLLGELVDAVM